MTATRRELVKAAAVLSAFAGGAACGREEAPKRAATIANPAATGPESVSAVKIDEQMIATAAKVEGLAFTPDERRMMVEGVEEALETLAKIRALEFGEADAPALVFDPKLPRAKIRSQKNILTLGRNYDAPFPKADDDVAFASVAQQGAWLRARKISSSELTNLYLERIGRFDRKLSAFITTTGDIAHAQAAKADEEFASGKDRGPLHGVPYALKDLADTAGVLTSWGAEPYRERVPKKDAEVVRKLKSAGAVMLGKTACGAIAYGDQWFGGVTKNPWNLKEGSSGSSAGSASAVSAGLCSFAIGTETLGSIISPSERCGTVGLRPTFGRVSRDGFMALCWSLDKVGPICRSVEDTAIVLAEINGYDADDPGAARFGFTYEGGADIRAMTIGYVPEWFEKGDDADRAALDAMRALGVTLQEFPWPKIDFSPLDWIVVIESAAAFSPLTLDNRDDQLAWQEADAWPNTWRYARLFPGVDYVQIDRLRRKLMQEMSAAFEGFDALIGPHYAGRALLATNATGHPQLALPAGFAQTPNRDLFDDPEKAQGAETSRTPRGISLWANLFEEGKIIAIGRALEEALDVSRKRPPGF